MTPGNADEAADHALAYSLFMSENLGHMMPERLNEFVDRARSVRHWLRVHGHDVARLPAEIMLPDEF